MDPNMLSYAAFLRGSTPFMPPTFGFGQVGGSQPSQQQPETDVDIVPETQPEPRETSRRGKRSHKKKEPNKPRRKHTYVIWTKDEEFTLVRAWVDVSEDPDVANFQMGSEFWNRIRALFYSTWGKGEHRDKDSISSKWTDINNKCHSFQEVYQRNYDNRPSGDSDIGVLTRTMEEYEKTKGVFPYYKCWELLRKSPKWAGVVTMTSSSRRRAKRSKTSSSVDPDTPTSDAHNVDLYVVVDVDEQVEEELARPPECWFSIIYEYSEPIADDGQKKSLLLFDESERTKFINEKKMIIFLQQSVKDDILTLLQHKGTTFSMWNALKLGRPTNDEE
ncbi:glutathione S-transferase T3-like [Helianthus annuus]|uniref:glutathione S-transferase T3-like n=1 Tax=Helianthus annuus TaxID=4232 RepID=UPI000B908A01|nr:glutathione S-transferase T3-like [Helianthus annuus]